MNEKNEILAKYMIGSRVYYGNVYKKRTKYYLMHKSKKIGNIPVYVCRVIEEITEEMRQEMADDVNYY